MARVLPTLLSPPKNPLAVGVVLAILSNILFAVLYVYGKWLPSLTGTEIFLWRMVMMWLCLLLFLGFSGKLKEVLAYLAGIQGLRAWIWLLIPTPIFASQLWLFMYAPLNGYGLAVSMGYFLFPLAMVAVGYVMGERLTRLQWLAVMLAAMGVVMEIVRTGQINWATFWVCLTYPIYYVLRRRQGVPALVGMFLDTTIIAPICLLWIGCFGETLALMVSGGWLFIKALGLGLVSVLALQSNLEANRLLPTSLFGLLGYLEPALLFILAVTVLGSAFSMDMLSSFGLIWAGIGCLLLQGLVKKKS